MTFPEYFEPKKTSNLFALSDKFNFLKELHSKNKLPKVLMLSGFKGSGKSTLINHLMFYLFDKDNYNTTTNVLSKESLFYNQFTNNLKENIIILEGLNFKNTKIEDIRNLKKKYFNTQYQICLAS